MMTDDQHRQIGKLLGFPDCCIEAWITDRVSAGYRRGVQFGKKRTQLERKLIQRQIEEILGRKFPDIDRYPRYVPCPECCQKKGGIINVG